MAGEDDKATAFEKARFDYAAKQYDHETTRQGKLEGKAQFYLAFVTTYLAAIFLTLPFLDRIQGWLADGSIDWWWKLFLIVPLLVLGIGLFVSLFGVLNAMRLRPALTPHPERLFSALFDRSNAFLGAKQTEKDLARAAAEEYAGATESLSQINNARAGWVKVSALGITFSIAALAVLLGTFLVLELYFSHAVPTEPLQIMLVTPTPAP